jgi:hypothetical protein
MPGLSTSSSTKDTTNTPSNIGYLNQGFAADKTALGQAQANAAGTTPTGFTAQMTPQQLQAYQSVYGAANGNTSAQTQQNTGALTSNAGAGGVQGALSGLSGYNPSIQGEVNAGQQYAAGQNIPAQVQAAMLGANQEANQVTLPGIDSAAAGSGNTNSSRTGIASGLVQQGLAQQAGALSAQLQGNAYNTGANLQNSNNSNILGGLQSQGSIGNSAVNSGSGALSSGVNDQANLGNQLLTGAGGAQQNQQLGFNNQNQAYQFGQNSPFGALQNYMGIQGMVNAGGTSNESSTSTPSFMSTVGSLLGGAGSLIGSKGGALGGSSGLLGAFGGGAAGGAIPGIASALGPLAMFSDRRLKQDIEQVGMLFDGTPVYRYRYIGQTPMQIGVMAQDIEQFAPEAVNEFHGYKMVDYEKATQRSLGHAGRPV